MIGADLAVKSFVLKLIHYFPRDTKSLLAAGYARMYVLLSGRYRNPRSEAKVCNYQVIGSNNGDWFAT